MTVAELLTLINDLYPSAATDAQKVKFMNRGQDTLAEFFDVVETDMSLSTIACIDEYSYPTNITDISQIETFDIANSVPDTTKIVAAVDMQVGAYTIADSPDSPKQLSVTHISNGDTDTLGTLAVVGTLLGEAVTETITPVADTTVYSVYAYDTITSITGAGWVTEGDADTISVGVKPSRSDFTRYEIGYKDDLYHSGQKIVQVEDSSGGKKLVITPAPSYTGLPIRIRYHRPLTELSASATTVEPDFDSKYHEYLAYYACYQICANGASPNAVQANRFAGECESIMDDLWQHGMKKKITAQDKRNYNRMWLRE